MNFEWTEEHQAFQQEVRDFLSEALSPELLSALLEGESIDIEPTGPTVDAFFRVMHAHGWQIPDLPKSRGGKELSPMEKLILISEMDYANAPRFMRATAVNVVPALVQKGTEENREMWLDKLVSREMTVSCGYSEPDAGTDLPNLRTRAVLVGDHWVINGQKTWNSRGSLSTHIWLLARTGEAGGRHKGLSIFMVPLDTPGVEVLPIPDWGHHGIDDVFFKDVRIPKSHLIGEEGQGWEITMIGLLGERSYFGITAPSMRPFFDQLVEHCMHSHFEGQMLSERSDVREGLIQLTVDLELSTLSGIDICSRSEAGESTDVEAIGLKIYSSELRTRLAAFAMDTLGLPGLLDRNDPCAPVNGMSEVLYRRAPIFRVGVGANEVIRDIVAQRGLGLPRLL